MISRPSSIRSHLVVALTSALIALSGLSAFSVFVLMRHALSAQVDDALLRTARDFAAETKRTVDGGIKSGFHNLKLEEYEGHHEDGACYELRDHNGNSVVRSQSLKTSVSLPFLAMSGDDAKFTPITLPNGRPGRLVQLSFSPLIEVEDPGDLGEAAEIAARTRAQHDYVAKYQQDTPSNRVHLSIAEDVGELRETLFLLAATLSISSLTLAVATYLLVRRVVRTACHPITELAAQTAGLQADQLHSRLPVERVPDELKPLIVTFNQFIERLDIALRREKRFSIDIAHELRTPVAEMRTLMEVACSASEENEPASFSDPHRIYQTGAAISQRLSKLIEVLTAIHGTEGHRIELHPEQIDLPAIVIASAKAHSVNSSDRLLVADPPGETGRFAADPAIVRAVVDNLITNALAHSPAGSPVEIRAEHCGFVISNYAPDLTDSDLVHLGEPFWQKDASRTASDHFGLGLTLVSLYLGLLDGRIVHKVEQGRLDTRVTFFCAPDVAA